MYLSPKFIKMFYQTNHFISIILLLYSLISLSAVSCNPSLNGLVTINDGNDQMQEESSSYLHFARIPDEHETRTILLQMANQSVHNNSDDLDQSATSNLAHHVLTNVNDNEQRHLQQQLQTNEDPLQKILPMVKFSCEGKKGYYADPDFNCEVFHYCNNNGHRFTLFCPVKSRYSMKAMTCVYEDHKLYECPGMADATNSSTSQPATDAQTTTLLNLTSETGNKMNEDQTVSTMSSSTTNKSTIDQMIESNKMSSWNDIINRNNKYSSNPTQLNSNDILESFNQITTTLSSKLNDDIVNLNNSTQVSLANQSNVSLSSSNDQQSNLAQFGTRFNSNGNTSKSKANSTKKGNTLTGYEDLATKYQKRKKIKTTTTISSVDDAGEIESTESTLNLTSQSSNNSNLTDKTYLTELSASERDQQYSTLSTINDQSNANQNNNNNHLNHHTDYKEINDQFTSYQFTGYQTNDDLGQANQNASNSGLLSSTFNNQFNQYDQSTDSGFKPIFMQTPSYQSKPMNHQFKYTNSKLPSFKDQVDTFDNLKLSMNRDNSIHSASSTSNPVLYLESTANITNAIINDSNKNNQNITKVSSNDLIKSTGDNGVGYQSRENFRMMVKNVSDQKLKDFIKNNDLIDLSSTSISTTQFNSPTNSPQIVPQILKEKRSRNKMNESALRQNTTGNAKQPQFNNNNLSNNWPKNSMQTAGPNKQSQYVNYWPNLNFQNLNKQYNSYNLDNIIESPEYKYDYVFGLSKVLPSFNTNFPPFLPDKSFIQKYPFLFNDYYPTELDLHPVPTALNGKIYAPQKKTSNNPTNNQDKAAMDTASSSNLPSWLKSKFSIKSPISRNTNSNSNNNQNAQFVNTNNFLHSAASSSFNYPLYELPPPSIIKQKQQQSPIALPLISPTQTTATNAQLNNLLNSQFILNNAILPSATPQINQQQQNLNSQNTRKTFLSQLTRLFSSASISRPVRVPYTANLASAFSSLAQPFSKLQIDNLSNQLFSPFKGFLNATTPYMPIRKENPSQSNGHKSGHNGANNDEDDLDELEKHILSANGISPYTLNPQSTINQPTIAQPTSNLGQQQVNGAPMQNPLNFNAYPIPNTLPALGQTLYGPIKRSSFPNGLSSSTQNIFPKHLTPKFGNTFPFNQQQQSEFFKSYLLQQQPQVRSMMINKPNDILQQSTNNQFSTIKFPQPSSLPFSNLANRNDDVMDEFLMDNDELFESDLNKQKRRRKRSIAYSPAVPLHTMHYSPKFSFPFLAPFVNPAPPIHNAYVHSLPPAAGYAFAYAPTPVLPPIIPQFSASMSTKPSSQSKLISSESQMQPQIIASSSSSISPTSTQSSVTSSSSSSSSSTLKSTSTLPNISSLSSLSLASAANQLAVSLATISNNLSKNHKNTKIAKHLSKLASSSSNFLPVISNLTSTLNNGLENLNVGSNKTLPRETVTVWQRPPGKPTFTTWSFSSIPSKELVNTFAARDFPFFNQYNTLRSIPAATYLVDARPPPVNLHPFNSQFNSLDLNSLAYHTLPLPNPLTQLPKLHVEYRPTTNFNPNNGFGQPSVSKTSATTAALENENGLKSNDIDEPYGKRKIMITTAEFSKFRDLLSAYNNKQTTNNLKEGQPIGNTFSSSSDSGSNGVGVSINANSHQPYSPNYGFPKNAKATIIFKSSSINKENDNGSPNQDISNQYLTQQHQINKLASSNYQSQSSNNRLVKLSSATTADKKIYSGPRFNAQYEMTNSKLKDDYRTDGKDFYYSEYDLAPAAPKNEMRKFGDKTSNNLDNDRLEEDDENDYNYGRNNGKNQNKYKKSNHLHGREFGLDDYENGRQPVKANKDSYKSMNRNLKLYTTNKNKKSDYLDNNYHETDDLEEDDEFFSKSKKLSKKNDEEKSKLSSRQLLSDPLRKNSDRDLKSSDDEEDEFFNQDDNNDDMSYREKYQPNKHPNPIKLNSKPSSSRTISHNRPMQSKSFAINKSNRKLIKSDDENDSHQYPVNSNSYYNPNLDTHQQVNDNHLNKNQLNFQQHTPRSVLVKTSSFSFEIPNHSEHEEVEFDDHIGKHNKIRPTYTLDQTARKTSALASSLSTSPGLIYHHTTTKHNRDEKYNSLDQPLQSNPSLADYDMNTSTAKFVNNLNSLNDNNLGMNGRNSRDETLSPFAKKTERQQQQYATSIEHKKGRSATVASNIKSNDDDDLFNQFEIKRQPDFIQNHNHHLPHSHLEDVEAYYSKTKDKKPTKFRQFFHQQELKHTLNAGKNTGKTPSMNSKLNILESLDNRYHQMEKQTPSVRDEEPIKNTLNDYVMKENSSKEKSVKEKTPVVSSPVQTKQPRIYFNWHSNINHNLNNKQQPSAASKLKSQEIEPLNNNNENDFNMFNIKDDENEPVIINKPNMNANKLNNHHQGKNNQKRQKTNTNSPHEQYGQPPPQPPMPKQKPYKPMPNPLDDDWFRQPELKLPNPPENLAEKQPPQQQQNPKPIKNDNHLDNNDIDSNPGDIEYDDDPLPKAQLPNQPNKQLNNQSKLKNNQPINNNFEQKQQHQPPPPPPPPSHSKKEFRPNIKAPIKLQVMDQQNKQYNKPATTPSTPNDKHHNQDTVKQPKPTSPSSSPQPNQASSKNSISPAYRTKYLKSSEFAEKQKISKNAFKNSLKPTTSTAATVTSSNSASSQNKETDKKLDYQKAKLINLQFKNDKENKKPDNLKPFSRMPSRHFGDKTNDKNAPEKPNADKNEKANANAGKKIIINSNLQNSSTTINAQVLEKLPISVDSIFDNIDDENFDYDADNNSPNNKKTDSLANDNLEFNNRNYHRKESENNSNENQSNENSVNDDQLITATNTTTGDEAHEYGARIRGNNGRLQPKVSIKASYSSVSSTIPRAMAQKMDKQKVDVVGFRSLDADDLTLKKESNLFKNRMKQFKKANWLSPLTSKQQTTIANNITTTTTTSSPPTTIKNDNSLIGNDKKDKKWKGFTSLQSRQQKLIEQKKSLDDKSMIKKPISSYLSKFKKEDKKNDKESIENKESSLPTTIATTTSKSTATTVPTTTLKSTTIEHQSTRLNELNKNRKLLNNNNKLDQFNLNSTTINGGLTNNDRINYSRTTSTTTTTTIATTNLPSTNNHRTTNYNLNFNNNVNLTNSTINNQNTTTTDSSKPIRQRIFSAFNAGTRYSTRT